MCPDSHFLFLSIRNNLKYLLSTFQDNSASEQVKQVGPIPLKPANQVELRNVAEH